MLKSWYCKVNFLHPDNHQPESSAVLAELENIDTQADKMNIAFVKICDLELVDEFGLTQLPSIVYYRQTIPIPYDGNLILDVKNFEFYFV